MKTAQLELVQGLFSPSTADDMFVFSFEGSVLDWFGCQMGDLFVQKVEGIGV